MFFKKSDFGDPQSVIITINCCHIVRFYSFNIGRFQVILLKNALLVLDLN